MSICVIILSTGGDNMFNEVFKKERKRLGLTQQQIAKKLNISRSNVANWESGSNTASPEMILKCSELFNCTTDYLYGKTEHRNIYEELDKNANLISLQNDTKVLDNISNEFELEETSAEKLLSELKKMGLLNDNEELTDEKLNIILDFIRNNKEMLKILLNK